MNIGILGTGAISHKHVQAYKNIGWKVVACSDIFAPAGEAFAKQYGCDFVPAQIPAIQSRRVPRRVCGAFGDGGMMSGHRRRADLRRGSFMRDTRRL